MEPFCEIQLNPENIRQPVALDDEVETQIDELEGTLQAILDEVAPAETVGQTGELRFSVLAPPEDVIAAAERVAPEWEAEGLISIIAVRHRRGGQLR